LVAVFFFGIMAAVLSRCCEIVVSAESPPTMRGTTDDGRAGTADAHRLVPAN